MLLNTSQITNDIKTNPSQNLSHISQELQTSANTATTTSRNASTECPVPQDKQSATTSHNSDNSSRRPNESHDIILNCTYSNVDSLPNKTNEIELFIHKANPHIICLTETIPKNQKEDLPDIHFKGYSSEEDDTGRGVSMYIKQEHNYRRRTDLELFRPSIVIEFTSLKQKVLVGVAYRSPSSSDDDNTKLNDMIEKISEEIKPNNDTCVLTGDFNYPDINWNNETTHKLKPHPAAEFLEATTSNNICQLVRQPTHHRALQSANILDLVLSWNNEELPKVSHHAPWGKSHHQVLNIAIEAQSTVTKNRQTNTTKYALDKGNYVLMREALADENWDELMEHLNVEESWNLLHSKLTELKDNLIPKKQTRSNLGRKNTVPKVVLDKIRNKHKAYNYYKRYKTKANYDAYARARNQVKWAIRKYNRDIELEIAKNIKSDPKRFYAYVSTKLKPKDKIANLTKPDNTLTESNHEKAEVLNSFFASVFTKENVSNIPTFNTRTPAKLLTVGITTKQMEDKLKNLNITKSEGPDGLHPRILKELAHELAHPLKLLFDKTILQEKIPTAWKLAEVRPIFKKGDKSNPGNYRPVSLTSIVCKIFESFIRDALNRHLSDNRLLSDHQFGFTTGRSCMTQLLSTLTDWHEALEKGEPVDAIYLDLQKAFDKVPHMRLLTKLKGYGIGGGVYGWISDFLDSRSQRVNVEGESSGLINITSGVPQGSVLGPTLFVYFINDMPDVVLSNIKIFADDTKIYSGVKNDSSGKKLQESLDNLTKWTESWQIKFNSAKCSVMHIGKDNPKRNYTMEGTPLDKSDAEKDLGVYVDNNLSFDHHVNTTVNKANKLAGMISHYITYKSPKVMIQLYKGLIRPVMEYGNPIWNPKLRKHIDAIENVQKKFTKRIIGMGDLKYEERMKKLKLPSLEYRRARGDMIETYKITHNLYDKHTTQFFNIHENSITRGHPYKITKRSCKSKSYAHFFTNRIINQWNSLPKNVVMAETINSFKNLLDKHWSNYMYITNFVIV